MRQLITCTRKNWPQQKTLLCCFSHYFPKPQHFLLLWHVCSQARGTAQARCICKSFVWRGEPISSNISPHVLGMTAAASGADPVVIAVQVALDCAWSVLPGEAHLLADRLGAWFPLNRLFREEILSLGCPCEHSCLFQSFGLKYSWLKCSVLVQLFLRCC